ncbi:MAG TPA: hypothetical protein VFM37_05185 [Pseudonocardiaceae bacterium]|nr:hypothetical protein [Pseudonocardiaceae bacterium]
MTPEDEAFLTEVHRNLDKQAIGPESPFFVHLEELPGNVLGLDPVPMLATRVRRATPGSMFFLTGLRGSGKSSQLRRFKQHLERNGFPVLLVDAEDYLNLRRPIGVTDMLFFLVGAISDQAVGYDLIRKSDAPESYGWSRLRDWLAKFRLETAEVAIKLPPVEGKLGLRAELRDNPSFVAQLRGFLDGRVAELVAQAHSIVEEMADQMRERWNRGEWKDLVVIVDSLDHNRAIEATTFLEVRRALVNLFDLDRAKLALPRCRTVFTLPSLVNAAETGVVRRVTNVKVADEHGGPNRAGIDALVEVLRKRIPGGELRRIFPDDDSVSDLAVMSGGNLRMLLQLAMEVITQAESLPVDRATVDSAIGEVRNSLLPLSDDERARLRRVAADHRLPLDNPECWEPVAELLDRRLVLGYRNGD